MGRGADDRLVIVLKLKSDVGCVGSIEDGAAGKTHGAAYGSTQTIRAARADLSADSMRAAHQSGQCELRSLVVQGKDSRAGASAEVHIKQRIDVVVRIDIGDG